MTVNLENIFGHNLSSQNTRNGFSEHQEAPSAHASFVGDFKQTHDFIYLKSWTVFCVNMIPPAFNSSEQRKNK